MPYNRDFCNQLKLYSDSPAGVETTVNDVNSQVSQVDSLLQNTDPTSPEYESLTTIKDLMSQLSTALSSYLALLQTGRLRMKRSTGKSRVIFLCL